MKKFIFSKFAGWQAYIWQLYYQINSFTGIFRQHFMPPMLPHVLTYVPPLPMFLSPVGNPAVSSYFQNKPV